MKTSQKNVYQMIILEKGGDVNNFKAFSFCSDPPNIHLDCAVYHSLCVQHKNHCNSICIVTKIQNRLYRESVTLASYNQLTITMLYFVCILQHKTNMYYCLSCIEKGLHYLIIPSSNAVHSMKHGTYTLKCKNFKLLSWLELT